MASNTRCGLVVGATRRSRSNETCIDFREAAATAARQWEFVPAIQNDRPVRVWVDVPFRFELEDR